MSHELVLYTNPRLSERDAYRRATGLDDAAVAIAG